MNVPEQAFRLVRDSIAVADISSRVGEIAAGVGPAPHDPADTLIRGRIFEIAAGLATQAGRLAEMAKQMTEQEEARRREAEGAADA